LRGGSARVEENRKVHTGNAHTCCWWVDAVVRATRLRPALVMAHCWRIDPEARRSWLQG